MFVFSMVSRVLRKTTIVKYPIAICSSADAAAKAGEEAAKGMTSDGEQALKKAQEVIDAVEKDLKEQQEKSESSSWA